MLKRKISALLIVIAVTLFSMNIYAETSKEPEQKNKNYKITVNGEALNEQDTIYKYTVDAFEPFLVRATEYSIEEYQNMSTLEQVKLHQMLNLETINDDPTQETRKVLYLVEKQEDNPDAEISMIYFNTEMVEVDKETYEKLLLESIKEREERVLREIQEWVRHITVVDENGNILNGLE